jgi:cell division protein FtsB
VENSQLKSPTRKQLKEQKKELAIVIQGQKNRIKEEEAKIEANKDKLVSLEREMKLLKDRDFIQKRKLMAHYTDLINKKKYSAL